MLSSLILTVVVAASGQTGPSFDCARASTPVERAICADAELAELDRRMADRYAAVRRALPAEARQALLEDQRWFLGVRDEAFRSRAEPWLEGFPDLAERMRDRIAFLETIDTGRRGLAGTWGNLAGVVEVRPAAGGRLNVELSAAHPLNARWICQTRFEAPPGGDGVSGVAGTDPDMRITLGLEGGVVTVSERRPDGERGQPGYCGHGGTLEGAYLPVRAG